MTGLLTVKYRSLGFWLGRMKFWNYLARTASSVLTALILPKSIFRSLPLSYTFWDFMKLLISFSLRYPLRAVSRRWKSEVGVKVYSSANISLTISSFLSTSAVLIKKSTSFCLVLEDCFFFWDDFLLLLLLLRFITYFSYY